MHKYFLLKHFSEQNKTIYFNLMDKDRSTDISIEELVNFNKSVAIGCDLKDVEDDTISNEIPSNKPDPETVYQFNHIDTNEDGVLTYDELNGDHF